MGAWFDVGKSSLDSATASNADHNFRALDQSSDGLHDTVSDADVFYVRLRVHSK